MGNSSSSPSANSADGHAPPLHSQPSYWQMAKQGYQDLVNAIIRPPRTLYSESQLGPYYFEFCGRNFIRTDIELRNKRGMKLLCSFWEVSPECRPNRVLPCIIYMHGNSSARLEALSVLSLALSIGATFFAFDFSGSGLSDGEYVSLGAFERDDLQVRTIGNNKRAPIT